MHEAIAPTPSQPPPVPPFFSADFMKVGKKTSWEPINPHEKINRALASGAISSAQADRMRDALRCFLSMSPREATGFFAISIMENGTLEYVFRTDP